MQNSSTYMGPLLIRLHDYAVEVDRLNTVQFLLYSDLRIWHIITVITKVYLGQKFTKTTICVYS